jgi:hypothetical protein
MKIRSRPNNLKSDCWGGFFFFQSGSPLTWWNHFVDARLIHSVDKLIFLDILRG